MTNDPSEIYAARLEQRRREVSELDASNARFAYARLAIFIIAAVVVWLALSNGFSILWVLAPVAAFVALMMAHERLTRRLERRRRAVKHF
ncbi:MAG TPA: hypothetical protein VHW24_25775, partial [Bryobacteraceae bacterium]|nr:hypothetical protein [Bryobacteraceae bacterium]